MQHSAHMKCLAHFINPWQATFNRAHKHLHRCNSRILCRTVGHLVSFSSLNIPAVCAREEMTVDDAKAVAELIADDLATYQDNSLVQTFMDGFQEFLDTPARVSCHKGASDPFPSLRTAESNVSNCG